VRANREAERGQIDDALRDLAAAQVMGRHTGRTPIIIGVLVQLAIESTVIQEMCHVVQVASRNTANLDRIHRTLDAFGGVADIRNAFGGEVVLGRMSIQKIRTTNDLSALSGDTPKGRGFDLPAAIRKAFEAKFLAAWRQVFATMPTDPNDWHGTYESLKKVEAAIEADHSPTNALNLILFPVFDAVPQAVAKQIANRRITAVSIRLMKIRIQTGRFPTTLPNLGELSVDPFDGKQLRYKQDGAGFRIYSVDSDLIDNGGTTKKSGGNGDLVRSFK
jgi:hypothetical protein